MKKIVISLLTATSLMQAAGYKVPEQSTDSVALLASNIATSFGPDATYYNPANMMFLPHLGHYFEGNLAWGHIHSTKFKSQRGVYKSNEFDIMATTLHFVSPEYYENLRFGISMTVPALVGIGWDDPTASFTGKKFKIKVVELNPTLAYRVSDNFSVAAGARALYAKGRVATEFYGNGDLATWGDGYALGYNLAMTFKPTEDWALSATYRSKVDLDVKGKSVIKYNGPYKSVLDIAYDGSANVSVPLPSSLVLATSYKINDTTLLFAFERTFWSKFVGYDFNYPDNYDRKGGLSPLLTSNTLFNKAFDETITKRYRDSNTYRLGVAHDINEKVRFMAGFAYDEKAAKDPSSVTFELPDTKTNTYSVGANYKFSENLEMSLAALYQKRRPVKSSVKTMQGDAFPSQPSKLEGEFQKSKIWIVSTGVKYKF